MALLISFVSSIATGIVTVTLMQQAPQSITQNINRVVERTIERVIPLKGPSVSETKIVKEEDLIVAAIEDASRSMVRIIAGVDTASSAAGDYLGEGAFISEDGLIVTDSVVALDPGQVYVGKTADDQTFTLSWLVDKRGFSLLKIIPKDKDKPAPTFVPVTFGDSDQVKVGQTVFSLGDSAASGIVSGLVYEAVQDASTTTPKTLKTLSYIRSSTNQRDTSGSVVMTLDGSVAGIVGTRGGVKVTIPANAIKDALAELAKKKLGEGTIDGAIN